MAFDIWETTKNHSIKWFETQRNANGVGSGYFIVQYMLDMKIDGKS